MPVFHFRPADASLLGDTFHKHFPNVLVLAGHDLPHAPKVRDPYGVTPETARALEGACRGGCLAAVRSGFEYIVYSTRKNRDRAIAVIIGSGVPIDGKRWWFDREGKPYAEEEVRKLEMPILTVGNCGEVLKEAASYRSPGLLQSFCLYAGRYGRYEGAFPAAFPEKSLFCGFWTGRSENGSKENCPVSSGDLDRLPQPPCRRDLSCT